MPRECTCSNCKGRETYTADYRQQCELNMVLRMPSRERRAAYLELIEKHRGRAAADRMKQELLRAWNERLANRNADDGSGTGTDTRD